MSTTADLDRSSRPFSTTSTIYDELSTLCRLHDAGSVSEVEFAARHVELLDALDWWLSARSDLLVNRDDPYALQRAASR